NLGSEDPPRAPRRRVLIRLLLGVAAVAVLLAGVAGGLFFERQRTYDRNTQRTPGAFPDEADRPPHAPGRAQNWLLVGSDRRAAQGSTGRGPRTTACGAAALR